MTWDHARWAEENFGGCELGDRRRNKRMVKVAMEALRRPAGSLPEQLPDWADLKAAYRLFDCEKVTFEAVGSAHWRRTKEQSSGDILVICDTTEIDFGIRRDIDGTGPTGNGKGNGYLLHNALFVQSDSKEVLGLGAQEIHTRPQKPRKDSSYQKLKRKRESQIWGQAVNRVGPPPKGSQYTFVGDRASDNYELFLHLQQNQHGWVLRAKARNRKVILAGEEEKVSLAKAMKKLPVRGEYELEVVPTKKRPGRTARLVVRSGSLKLPPPRAQSPFVKEHGSKGVLTNVIWVRERNPPRGAPRMEWVLYTSMPVDTFSQCWKVLDVYETRWTIEEFHKALKTGCRVESLQLQSAHRLQPATALLSVMAVALLQLKTQAKRQPDRKASTVVPGDWLKMLKAVRPKLKRVHDMTIRDFYREVAKLGGFLGRRSDGDPGWITTWRGWQTLHMLMRGAQVFAQQQNTS